MPEPLLPDPWRTRADYNQDRARMKYVVIAAMISAVAAVLSSIAALTAIFVAFSRGR